MNGAFALTAVQRARQRVMKWAIAVGVGASDSLDVSLSRAHAPSSHNPFLITRPHKHATALVP